VCLGKKRKYYKESGSEITYPSFLTGYFSEMAQIVQILTNSIEKSKWRLHAVFSCNVFTKLLFTQAKKDLNNLDSITLFFISWGASKSFFLSVLFEF
jgi:hypothetical protein